MLVANHIITVIKKKAFLYSGIDHWMIQKVSRITMDITFPVLQH
jgi:hypothetical protein